MEIIWYGHACFRLRDRGLSIITDPYGKDIGYQLPRLRADVVTISHDHPDHNCVENVREVRKVFSGPGEYEVGGTFITGIPTWHDKRQGKDHGPNTVFVFEMDNLTVCHLGDLGHVPTQSQVEVLSNIDILLIPVGGGTALTASQAAEVISLLDPLMVIPMHYKTPLTTARLSPLSAFLKEMGLSKTPSLEMLKITKGDLPEETQVVILEPKQQ